MNEFIAKKLGEVLAFIRSSNDTATRAHVLILEAVGAEKVAELVEKSDLYSKEINAIAREGGVETLVEQKAAEDILELQKMRSVYLGDNWNDVGEVFEWSSFVEGASIAHWALIRGAAQTLSHERLLTLAEEAVNWHYEVLEILESELESIGSDKAAS